MLSVFLNILTKSPSCGERIDFRAQWVICKSARMFGEVGNHITPSLARLLIPDSTHFFPLFEDKWLKP